MNIVNTVTLTSCQRVLGDGVASHQPPGYSSSPPETVSAAYSGKLCSEGCEHFEHLLILPRAWTAERCCSYMDNIKMENPVRKIHILPSPDTLLLIALLVFYG